MKKIGLIRTVALILALSAIMLCGVACSQEKEVKDPILVYGDTKMPLYFYEYMLSLKKGELSSNKYDVKSKKFWTTEVETGETYEEYFNRTVLETCVNYFASSVLFDQMGLSLSDAALEKIDEDMEFFLDYFGDWDEEKLNEMIDEYGVTYEELRECYIILAKHDAVIYNLYGDGALLADSLKNQYYKDNYYRFKQVLFRSYYYEYEIDDWNQEIYFSPDNGLPLYDSKNGKVAFDDEDEYIVDDYGQRIYFGENGKPLYDTKNGQKAVKYVDGTAVRHDYSAEELAERLNKAMAIAESVGKKNYTDFESKIAEMAAAEDFSSYYADGYYLSEKESVNYAKYPYMNDILDLLETMEEGEIRLHISEYGYHVVMKYPLDDGRFSDGEYAEWFDNFVPSLISEMYLIEIEDILPDISTVPENLEKAKSIVDIGINYNFDYFES